MEFHGAKKYLILKRLRELDRSIGGACIKIPDWIKQIVICNEFGSGPYPNPHSHVVLVTKKR